MIAVLAGGYLAIGLVLALAAAGRRASLAELAALLVTWPLYAPLYFERPAPTPATERTALLAAALDRTNVVIGGSLTTADDAHRWLARLAAAHEQAQALERALARRTTGDEPPVVARARAEHRRRRDALAAIEADFAELSVLVGLATWVADVEVELTRVLTALAMHLDLVAPPGVAPGE